MIDRRVESPHLRGGTNVATDASRWIRLKLIDAELVRDPGRFPTLTGPFAGMRPLRVGNGRVIFVIVDQDVVVLRIQDRKDVYRGSSTGRGATNQTELSRDIITASA